MAYTVRVIDAESPFASRIIARYESRTMATDAAMTLTPGVPTRYRRVDVFQGMGYDGPSIWQCDTTTGHYHGDGCAYNETAWGEHWGSFTRHCA